jgi:hypothetical protein
MPLKPPKHRFAFLRRRKLTCLDCGFLTIEGRELSEAERIMLGTRGVSAVMPANPELTRCARSRWTEYELTYPSNSLDGVFEVIDRPREGCPEFLQHEGGYTPAQHFELQEQRRRERHEWRIARLGFFGGVLGAFIGSFLRDIPHWVVSLWRLIVKP